MSEATTAPAPRISVLHGDYFSQIMPEPLVVCGLRLKPLSIGRYRLMSRFNVAFVAENPITANAGDLLMGAIICSMTCDDFTAFVSCKNFKKQLQKWGRKAGLLPPRYFACLGLADWFENTAIGRAIAEKDAAFVLSEMSKFQKYIVEGSSQPPYWNEAEGGRVSGAHWSQSIEAVLREFQGWTKDEINEEPLTKALWDYFKHMENSGAVRLMTEGERIESETPEAPEKLAEMEAWLKAIEEAKAREVQNG